LSRTPDERLAAAADLFRERNRQYGGNYTKFGPVMASMFPDGIILRGEEELGRLVLFAHLLTKLTRYAQNMDRGGHEDSLDDMSVYAMMLAEHDEKHRPSDTTPRVAKKFTPTHVSLGPDGPTLAGTVQFEETDDEWRRRRAPAMPVPRPSANI